ncbi:DUF4087 domain-containing protein [Pseudorhodobacter sp. MZDSW-24AT]|uniref:DUF4087 domain-containing protein n=1 Tax=Pseudorhodobacter sp. MZDSW-24AT TaxID=2052957 RepID=UPI0012FDB61E|nr:DUF4087 domain-containing protein [Pseudorhodobacter sp. MZDSW-24AT]
MAAFWIKALTLGLACAWPALPALAADVKRCGWYANPTPGNHWLTDRDATWTLSTQGGAEVPGWMDLPAEAFAYEPGSSWVETNGSYGYGCACITGRFGPATAGEVLRVAQMQPLPLSRCETDPNLPKAEG